MHLAEMLACRLSLVCESSSSVFKERESGLTGGLQAGQGAGGLEAQAVADGGGRAHVTGGGGDRRDARNAGHAGSSHQVRHASPELIYGMTSHPVRFTTA